jgi:hypothetical protein
MRLMRLLALVAVAWAATVATPLLAQRPAFAPPDPARDEVQVLHVKDQVWMIVDLYSERACMYPMPCG